MKRWLFALPLSVLCVFALFSVMAALVTPADNQTRAGNSPVSLDVLVTPEETETNRRERAAPPKPPVTVAPPSLALSTPSTTLPTPAITTSLPDISMDVAVEGLSVAMPSFGEVADVAVPPPSLGEGIGYQGAVPLVRVEPVYPAKALKRGIEGYVIVQFTIDENGNPMDLSVLEASPKRVFDREALRAAKRWKYAPKLVNGKAVSQPGQTVKVEFNLTK